MIPHEPKLARFPHVPTHLDKSLWASRRSGSSPCHADTLVVEWTVRPIESVQLLRYSWELMSRWIVLAQEQIGDKIPGVANAGDEQQDAGECQSIES